MYKHKATSPGRVLSRNSQFLPLHIQVRQIKVALNLYSLFSALHRQARHVKVAFMFVPVTSEKLTRRENMLQLVADLYWISNNVLKQYHPCNPVRCSRESNWHSTVQRTTLCDVTLGPSKYTTGIRHHRVTCCGAHCQVTDISHLLAVAP